jgi:hypothetical protein
MSYANKWLRYLEGIEKRNIVNITLNGEKPKSMPSGIIIYDEHNVKNAIRQNYSRPRKGTKIPDKIKVDAEIKSVEIVTKNGMSFTISKKDRKKPQIKIKRQTLIQGMIGKTFSFEEEQKYVEEAEKLGYEIADIGEKQI